MNRIRIAAVALFLAAISVAVSAQDYPAMKRGTRIQDFANKLSSQEERQLDAKLADYEAKTSIQMVVVVATTLNGETRGEYATGIGRYWGIGQKDARNGIVILWYPRERDYFIAPGYGLEGDLTDGAAGQIARENLVPSFREERWAQGLNRTVDALIAHLGTMSWADRQSARYASRQRAAQVERERVERSRIEAEEAERQRVEASKRAVDFMINGVIVIAVIAFVIGGFFGIKSVLRKRRLREVLRADLATRKQRLAEIHAGLLGDLGYTLERLALDEDKTKAQALHAQAERELIDLGNQIERWSGLVESDPDSAERQIKVYRHYDKAAKAIKKMKDLAEEYSQSLVEAPAVIAAGHTTLAAVEQAIQKVVEHGYKPGHEKVLTEARELLSEAQTKLDGKPANPVEAIRLVNQAVENLNNEQARCENLPALRLKTAEDLGTAATKVEDLRRLREDPDYNIKVEKLRDVCGEAVWKDPLGALKTASSRLEKEERRIAQTHRLNSMELQKFVEAQVEALSIQNNLAQVEADLASVESVYDAQVAAKDEAAAKVKSAKERIKVRANLVVHQDTSADTSQAYDVAAGRVTALAKKYEDKKVDDWVALVTDLETNATAAENAVVAAQAEIKQAKEDREAEQTRLAELAAAAALAATQRAEESTRTQSTNSGGGFEPGGGDFGGGGAGGKY